jgi:hypothetical protein
MNPYAVTDLHEATDVPHVHQTGLLWADVQIGMLTIKGMVMSMDRRFTTDGAVMVTIGTLAPTIYYDVESVAVYGRVF